MSSLALLVRRAQALIDTRNAAAQSAGPRLEDLFGPEAIAEVKHWRAGGPVPVTAQGLELLAVDIQLGERV